MAQITVHELGRTAQCPAVDVAGDALHVLGVFVAPWRCHLEQDRELSWHHQVAGRGSCEHEPPAPSPLLERELLRQCAAPRQTEHVHLRVPNLSSSCALSRANVEGRYGSQGDGEPPTPGTSKTIASGPSNASRNGWTSSILAPIPLKMRSGGRAFSPRRMPTRSICPSTSCRLICIYHSMT